MSHERVQGGQYGWVGVVLQEVPRELCMHAKSFSHVQFFVDPMDCSPPGSSVQGISQARTLEWVASVAPTLGDLPDTGTEPMSLMSHALAGTIFTTGG